MGICQTAHVLQKREHHTDGRQVRRAQADQRCCKHKEVRTTPGTMLSAVRAQLV